MERELKELSVDLNRTDIFLTHFHGDHSGLAIELCRPGTLVYLSAVDVKMMELNLRDLRWRERNDRFYYEGFSKEELYRFWGGSSPRERLPKERFSLIREGDRLHYGGYVFECVDTAGHTPGHMCLYCREEKLAFLGDHVLFDITPNIVAWEELPDALGTYMSNLKKLDQLDIRYGFPGHREWKTDAVHERIAEILEHHRLRLEETLNAVSKNPGATAYELAGKVTWKIKSASWEEFPISQKFFAGGEIMSHLEYLEVRGIISKRREGPHFHYYRNGDHRAGEHKIENHRIGEMEV